eukprot:520043-Karenia_brevis.AAC.1
MSSSDALRAVIQEMVGKPTKELDHVDLGEMLASSGLGKFYPVEVWRLDFAYWMAAWDAYSLAADALGQFPFALATKHKQVVMEVAAGAGTED